MKGKKRVPVDAQGNIIAILDNYENVEVKYIYDGWGNHAVLDSNGEDIESGIVVLNPFRYRGYYYDEESKLYYLITRYYDPWCGQFISSDSFRYLAPETIGGINLYAYCNYNPIMFVDPSGEFTITNSFVVDLFSFLMEVGIGSGLTIFGWAIKTGVRPNNIGIGIYKQKVNINLTKLNTASLVLSKISTGLAVLSVGVSVIDDLINDVEKGYSFERTLSNTVTNIAVYGGTTFALGFIGGKIGALVGSFVPVLGNVVGATVGFALGMAISCLLDLQINGKSIMDHIRDGVYNFWTWLFGG